MTSLYDLTTQLHAHLHCIGRPAADTAHEAAYRENEITGLNSSAGASATRRQPVVCSAHRTGSTLGRLRCSCSAAWGSLYSSSAHFPHWKAMSTASKKHWRPASLPASIASPGADGWHRSMASADSFSQDMRRSALTAALPHVPPSSAKGSDAISPAASSSGDRSSFATRCTHLM